MVYFFNWKQLNQFWNLDPEGYFVSRLSGMVIDIEGKNKKQGAKVHMWEKKYGPDALNQKWYPWSQLLRILKFIAGRGPRKVTSSVNSAGFASKSTEINWKMARNCIWGRKGTDLAVDLREQWQVLCKHWCKRNWFFSWEWRPWWQIQNTFDEFR